MAKKKATAASAAPEKAAKKKTAAPRKSEPSAAKSATPKKKTAQKTLPTGEDVAAFVEALPDATQRDDARSLVALFGELSGDPPKLWRGGMIGFGDHHYKYASGHEGDTFRVGFAPRKGNLVLYVLSYPSPDDELLARLGKHKAGKGCLYLKRLADVDLGVVRELVRRRLAEPG